jgi:predicted transcriptional regulator
MSMQNVKEAARQLVENLPEDVTWDDLMYRIYVRQNIEAGLADSEANRVVEVEEVRKRFGLGE